MVEYIIHIYEIENFFSHITICCIYPTLYFVSASLTRHLLVCLYLLWHNLLRVRQLQGHKKRQLKRQQLKKHLEHPSLQLGKAVKKFLHQSSQRSWQRMTTQKTKHLAMFPTVVGVVSILDLTTGIIILIS